MLTLPVVGCSNGQPGTQLAIDFSALVGTVIDLSGATAGNVTITVGGTVPSVAGDIAPELVEILAVPDITASTGATSTYTPGASHALPSVSLIENAVGALGCSAGATATPAGATITFRLPPGVLFAGNTVPSIANTDPQFGVMVLGISPPSINQEVFYVPCLSPSRDAASSPANYYKPATIALLGAAPPSVNIPSNFTGDLKATVTYKLSDGTIGTKEILLAQAPAPPPPPAPIPALGPWAMLAMAGLLAALVVRRRTGNRD